jgi:hypothetical protein
MSICRKKNVQLLLLSETRRRGLYLLQKKPKAQAAPIARPQQEYFVEEEVEGPNKG